MAKFEPHIYRPHKAVPGSGCSDFPSCLAGIVRISFMGVHVTADRVLSAENLHLVVPPCPQHAGNVHAGRLDDIALVAVATA